MSDTVRFEISMSNDEEGFFGRECPDEECLGYFKIELGTGLDGDDLPCHCPYCGHTGSHDTFWTQDQLEHARSLAMREVQKYVGDMLRSSLPRSRPRRGDIFSVRLEYKPGRPLPIYRYQEKELETTLVCTECGLRYAVYGVFAYCPDCGSHNSLQILQSNLDLAAKQVQLAGSVGGDLGQQLIADALENSVSAFDAFGREIISVNANIGRKPELAKSISCQNVDRLRERVRQAFEFDLAHGFTDLQWQQIVRAFQKRHLLAHRAGVVDEGYIRATGDESVAVGRKMQISESEVEEVLPLVADLGEQLHSGLRLRREALSEA